MKNLKLTLSVMILFISLKTFSQNFQWEWLKKGSDNVSLNANVIDNANNSFIVGSISGSNTAVGNSTYNATLGDGIIIKYDTNGNIMWSTSIGGQGNEICSGISIDGGGNIFVVGCTTSSVISISNSTLSYVGGSGWPDYAIFISKFNSSGNLVYFKTVSHGGLISTSDLKLSLGLNSIIIRNSIFTNTTIAFGTNSLTAQNDDAFIASFDLNANFNWVKFYSSSGGDYITDLTVQKNDDIYFTGSTSSQALVIGSTTLSSPSTTNYLGFVGRMSPSGNIKWLNTFPNANVTIPKITAVNTNSIYLAFSFASTALSLGSSTYSSQNYDGLVVQIDSMGNYNWSKLITGNNGAGIRSIVVNQNNYIYVIGSITSSVLSTANYSIANSNTVSNMYFTAFDAQGKDWGFLMSIRPTANTNYGLLPFSISTDVSNNAYVVGFSNSDLVCGTQSITSTSQNNSFIAKIKLLNGVGIQETVTTNNDVIIFPNPTSSTLNINSQTFKIASVEILNALGQSIFQKQNADLNESLDVSFLNAGIYFVKIQNQSSQKTIKVIKE